MSDKKTPAQIKAEEAKAAEEARQAEALAQQAEAEEIAAAEAKAAEEKAAQEKAAEAEKELNETATSPVPDAQDGFVYVCSGLPSAQRFALTKTEEVILKGYPVSGLYEADGKFIPGGRFGITPVKADVWDTVLKKYGKMRLFTSGIICAYPTVEGAKAMAKERKSLRHGLEPVDPTATKSTSYKKDDA